MKILADSNPRWYFVDEAGDPAFYGKGRKIIIGTEGCSRTFLVGFLWTLDPECIRKGLDDVRQEVVNDPYLKDIPSLSKSLTAFHAKDDCPEVRYKVFTALSKMEFRVNAVVARKREPQFRHQFECSQDKFYDYLVGKLLGNRLHTFSKNMIVFARRGTKSRQHALREAVGLAVEKFRYEHQEAAETEIIVKTSYPIKDPVLQAADYAMWAIQRAFEKREMRYFEFLRPKYHLVWDIFDFQKKRIESWSKLHYQKYKNNFDIEKTSPLS